MNHLRIHTKDKKRDDIYEKQRVRKSDGEVTFYYINEDNSYYITEDNYKYSLELNEI